MVLEYAMDMQPKNLVRTRYICKEAAYMHKISDDTFPRGPELISNSHDENKVNILL